MRRSWPNGGTNKLAPADYYRVRFLEASDCGQAAVGDVGVVVDHVLSEAGEPGCLIEVGPWGEHGTPKALVAADSAILELIKPDP